MRGRCLAAVVAVAVAVAAAADGARKDGDPASDTLVYQNVFVPYPAPSKAAQAKLTKAVDAAYAKGYRLKVAVVASPADLGAIPSLYNRPAQYAKFLGLELRSLFVGPLLIAMPHGYGIWDGGRTTAAERKVLAHVAAPGTSNADDLTAAATATVAKLVAAKALRSKDILAPLVTTASAALSGTQIRVVYYLEDDSGRAAAHISVVSDGKPIFTSDVPFRPTKISRPEQIDLHLRGALTPKGVQVCIVGVDPAGNKSRKACAPLR